MTAPRPVVILAGGEGSRIGGGKPARMLGGQSLIDRAVERARSWSPLVAVAVRNAAAEGDVPHILDEPDIEGPLAGLAAALRFAREAGAGQVLVMPCDMPFLPVDLPQRLADGMGAAAAAIAESAGEIHPVCSLWRVAAYDRLHAHAAQGRRSLRGFAAAVGFTAVHWDAAPVDPFFNINSEEDLARAQAMLDAATG